MERASRAVCSDENKQPSHYPRNYEGQQGSCVVAPALPANNSTDRHASTGSWNHVNSHMHGVAAQNDPLICQVHQHPGHQVQLLSAQLLEGFEDEEQEQNPPCCSGSMFSTCAASRRSGHMEQEHARQAASAPAVVHSYSHASAAVTTSRATQPSWMPQWFTLATLPRAQSTERETNAHNSVREPPSDGVDWDEEQAFFYEQMVGESVAEQQWASESGGPANMSPTRAMYLDALNRCSGIGN